MTIEIPDWCVIGKYVEWNASHITGNEWVTEKIISYGIDGFFHKVYTIFRIWKDDKRNK